MATVTRTPIGFNNDTATVSYSYDDVSLLILSVTLKNTGVAGTVHYVVRDPNTQAVLASGSLAFGLVDKTDDISGQNLHMVNVLGKGGVSTPQLPVILQASWG